MSRANRFCLLSFVVLASCIFTPAFAQQPPQLVFVLKALVDVQDPAHSPQDLGGASFNPSCEKLVDAYDNTNLNGIIFQVSKTSTGNSATVVVHAATNIGNRIVLNSSTTISAFALGPPGTPYHLEYSLTGEASASGSLASATSIDPKTRIIDSTTQTPTLTCFGQQYSATAFGEGLYTNLAVYGDGSASATATATASGYLIGNDSDGDGVPDSTDQCPGTAAGAAVDAAGCSAAQRDSDHDGVPDSIDQCPGTASGAPVDASGCSAAQRDSDHDGVPDSVDACPGTAPGTPVDAQGCPKSYTLKITLGRDQIEPSFPPHNIETTDKGKPLYPVGFGWNLVLVTALVQDSGGLPVSGKTVAFTAGLKDLTISGHAHTGTGFPDILFVDVQTQSQSRSDCGTDADGQCQVYFEVPEFSGTYNITAQTLDAPDASASLRAGIQGLQPLAFPGFHYGLSSGIRPQHPSDKYGVSAMLSAIQALADDYNTTYPQEFLSINDMSLPLGGLFDINGDWNSPHLTHRDGHSVDIDRQALGGQPIKQKRLDFIAIKLLGLIKFKEPTIHYELPQ